MLQIKALQTAIAKIYSSLDQSSVATTMSRVSHLSLYCMELTV